MKKDVYELTNPQKSIWYTEQFYKGTTINSICGTAIINETVNFDLLKKAINHIILMNKSFSLKFTIENNTPKQYFSNVEAFIDFIDVDSMQQLRDFRQSILKIPLDIEKNSLFKFYIFRFPNNHGGFIINIHHLIADAWT